MSRSSKSSLKTEGDAVEVKSKVSFVAEAARNSVVLYAYLPNKP